MKNENDETEWDRRGSLKCMAWVVTGAVWGWGTGDSARALSYLKRFASVLNDHIHQVDSDQQFSYRFGGPGTYPYYCSIHPKITGRVLIA